MMENNGSINQWVFILHSEEMFWVLRFIKLCLECIGITLLHYQKFVISITASFLFYSNFWLSSFTSQIVTKAKKKKKPIKIVKKTKYKAVYLFSLLIIHLHVCRMVPSGLDNIHPKSKLKHLWDRSGGFPFLSFSVFPLPGKPFTITSTI